MQLAKLSFNHPSVVLTADVFNFFIENISRVSCEIENAINSNKQSSDKISGFRWIAHEQCGSARVGGVGPGALPFVR